MSKKNPVLNHTRPKTYRFKGAHISSFNSLRREELERRRNRLPQSTEVVEVIEGTASRLGGCNGCTQHINELRWNDHKVWDIKLRGVSVRVCEHCREKLLNKLEPSNSYCR